MPHLSEEIRQKILAYLPRYPNKQAVTLPALHIVHDAHREVTPAAIVEIAKLLELNPAEVADTMTFYQFFKEEGHAMGKHRVWVCRSISCMLRGSEEMLLKLSERTGVKPGHNSADGKFTLEFAECLGACEGAPCMLVDEDCHMNLDDESAARLLEQL
jgi:NADH-quinone oxidoreductase subunit E